MGDDDEGALELPQIALEPLDRGDVEVVGGLVEQQHVGLGEERLGEQDAQPEAARELAHRPLVAGVLDAEAGEQSGGLWLRLVAAQLGDRELELGEALAGRGADRVLAGAEQARLLLERGPEPGATHQHDVEQAQLVEAELVLAERADAQRGGAHDGAGVGAKLAGHEADQRRLAGAVRADEAVVAAGAELPAGALVEELPAEAHREVAERDHRGCVALPGAVLPRTIFAAGPAIRERPAARVAAPGPRRSRGTPPEGVLDRSSDRA